MRIYLAQLHAVIGDLAGNYQRILEAYEQGAAQGAELVVTPELAITGYPPKDLLFQPDFLGDTLKAIQRLKDATQGRKTALLLGAPCGTDDAQFFGHGLSNGAWLFAEGHTLAVHRKILLPNYDVFDERRYFVPGSVATCADLHGTRIGISICEDLWNHGSVTLPVHYARDPVTEQVAAGAEILVNLSASPYARTKPRERLELLTARATQHQVPIVYVNQVGAHDRLIFDGHSLCVTPAGGVHQLQGFEADADLTDTDTDTDRELTGTQPKSDELRAIADALCLGIRDFARTCGMKSAVLGLSGGIDSAVVAALSARALGAGNVVGVAMPSRYSSAGSVTDAVDLAHKLGIRLETIAIEPMHAAFASSLQLHPQNARDGLAEENLQARIRGTLLMAFANRHGHLLLNTGNKSEIAVGYCTLYGDMCGGLSPIGDLYKTEVYALAEWLNQEMGQVIPASTIEKPPSAELRPNQTDQQSLPPYPVLDSVLKLYLEDNASVASLYAAGFDAPLVAKVLSLVERSEHKRWQMPPALRISKRAFGEGWRMPIAKALRA